MANDPGVGYKIIGTIKSVNGIFNLNPNRDGIFTELARVVRR